jgi:hypothetical protein
MGKQELVKLLFALELLYGWLEILLYPVEIMELYVGPGEKQYSVVKLALIKSIVHEQP